MLIRWAQGLGSMKRAGIEETSSSYGTEVVRHQREAGSVVVEVERPTAGRLRRNGKPYPRDVAESAG